MKKPVIASIVLASLVFAGSNSVLAGNRDHSFRQHESERHRMEERSAHRGHDIRDRHYRQKDFHHRDRRLHRYHRAHRYAKLRRHHHWRRHHGHPGWKRHYRYSAMRHHHRHVHGHHARVEVHTHAPAVAGALVGGALANHASHGDPGATMVGAVMGAVIAGNHH